MKAIEAELKELQEVIIGVKKLELQFETALSLLHQCIGDGGAISFPLYEEIEKFLEWHRSK